MQRARLLAALTAGTVVVEAGIRSGSLQVVQRARDLGRPIGAFPGPVTSPASAGPNELIVAGLARLVRNGSDIRALIEGEPTPLAYAPVHQDRELSPPSAFGSRGSQARAMKTPGI